MLPSERIARHSTDSISDLASSPNPYVGLILTQSSFKKVKKVSDHHRWIGLEIPWIGLF